MLSPREFHRQLMHIAVGLITIALIYINLLRPFTIFLMILVGILASILCKRTRLPFFSFLLDRFEREEQRRKFPGKGMIFLFIGVLLSLQLFERDIALAAIMVLTLGDSVSHIFGAQFGQIRNIFNGDGKKLFEGTLAGALAGFLGAWLFVPFSLAFLGSFAGMIAEVVKIELNENTLDDNLVVPLVAGTVMLLIRSFL